MRPEDLTYPKISGNENRKSWDFWNSLGMDIMRTDDIRMLADTLFEAPAALYSDDGFIVNKYGRDIDYAEGKISLGAARRILGGEASEDSEIIIRMFEAGRFPAETDIYDAELKISKLSEEEKSAIPEELRDPIILEKIPEGMEYGSNYDFTLIHAGSDEYILEPSKVKSTPIEEYN